MWPAKSRTWATTRDKLDQLDREGKIHYPKSGMPRLKQFESEYNGTVIQDIWSDINQLHNLTAERLGYPTQKPLALLERIILASSNPGEIVLDPFSGCGTAISAAQKLSRRWIGIDITHLAIALHKIRLKDHFSLEPGKDYAVVGEPTELQGARQLASEDRYQFQWWALSLIHARPLGGTGESKIGKKGSDKGIDGCPKSLFTAGYIQNLIATKRVLPIWELMKDRIILRKANELMDGISHISQVKNKGIRNTSIFCPIFIKRQKAQPSEKKS